MLTTQLSNAPTMDAQRIEDALSVIAPKWTTWVVQTLAQQHAPARLRDVAARLPFVSKQLVGHRLAQMQADGLVTRVDHRHGAPYQLSAFGASLSPVHCAVSDWSRTHLVPGTMAAAERIEDALRRLQLRHSTAVLQALDANGPMRFVHIAEEIGLDSSFARQRLIRLQLDGLVTRTGPRHGDPYILTDAGAALGPVYATVHHWSSPIVHRAPATVPAATRTHSAITLRSEGTRTAAALRRTPAAPAAHFSHAPQPQPRVPAAVTVLPTPSRTR